jgi:hypothetical protein
MIWGDENDGPEQRHAHMKTYIETQLFAPFQAAFAFNPLRALVYLMFRETKRRRSTFTAEELDQATTTVQVCGRLMLLHINHGRTGPVVYPILKPNDINRFRVYLSTVIRVTPYTKIFEELVAIFVRELTPPEPNATLVPLPYHQEKWLGFTPAMWKLLIPAENWNGIKPPTPEMFAKTPFYKGESKTRA